MCFTVFPFRVNSRPVTPNAALSTPTAAKLSVVSSSPDSGAANRPAAKPSVPATKPQVNLSTKPSLGKPAVAHKPAGLRTAQAAAAALASTAPGEGKVTALGLAQSRAGLRATAPRPFQKPKLSGAGHAAIFNERMLSKFNGGLAPQSSSDRPSWARSKSRWCSTDDEETEEEKSA